MSAQGAYPASNTMIAVLGSLSVGFTLFQYSGFQASVASADVVAADFFEGDQRYDFKARDLILAQLTDGTYLLEFNSSTTVVIAALGI